MNEERKKILEMLQQGKVTVEEAEKLLAALALPEEIKSGAGKPACKYLRIVVEPGRAIAGPGTVTVYEVGTLKDVPLGHGAADLGREVAQQRHHCATTCSSRPASSGTDTGACPQLKAVVPQPTQSVELVQAQAARTRAARATPIHGHRLMGAAPSPRA